MKTKRMLLLLGITVVILSTNAYAELYSCTDRSGNPVITSTPSSEMTNCAIRDSSKDDADCPGCSREKKDVLRHMQKECSKPYASLKLCEAYWRHLGIGVTGKKQGRQADMEEKIEQQNAEIERQNSKVREYKDDAFRAEINQRMSR
jgi:4-hydroxy-3-methylbut-2-en-1-yl diphosphate synthase IspG/GcpE